MANFCDAGYKRSGYIKCKIVTFYVKSNDSAGKVGKLVIAASVAQLKCVCALACECTYLRLSQERVN
jgi:hypothetical protein